MKTKLMSADTATNNGLALPDGFITLDNEAKALRLHLDGIAGGYEILGQRAVELNVGPGPEVLVAGTMDAGFFGEVTSAELLTYEALATQIGLSAGVSQFNEESLWLKFTLDNKILFVAKKPVRHTVSWNDINTANAVYEGGSQIAVGSHTLDVTLLRGAASDPTVRGGDAAYTGYDIDLSHGSEWNRLMYPIHSGVHTNTSNPAVHTDPTAAPFGSWASYSDADLLAYRDFGNGSYVWTQEASGDDTSYRVYLGRHGVSYLARATPTFANTSFGWRPCLRLVV